MENLRMNEICTIVDFDETVQGRPEYPVLGYELAQNSGARNYSKNEE